MEEKGLEALDHFLKPQEFRRENSELSSKNGGTNRRMPVFQLVVSIT